MRARALGLACLGAGLGLSLMAAKPLHLRPPHLVAAARTPARHVPLPRPRPGVADTAPQTVRLEPLPDMSHAIPVRDIGKLPSTAEQFESLRNKLLHDRPAVIAAQKKSDALKEEAMALQRKLIATAARVLDLESEKVALDVDIAKLAGEDKALSASFAHDRVGVSRLLAILERLQHDMPPAMVLRPDDALGAARSSMLIGASLPNVYGQAAALARRIAALKKVRQALIARRQEGLRNAANLLAARRQLDQLLATKQREADAATGRYGDLRGKLDKAAMMAADLKSLMDKVARLRSLPAQKDVFVVGQASPTAVLRARSLLTPVVGRVVGGGLEGIGGASAPGLTYQTQPGAQVIAPADSQVLFAGPYHKTGSVLILEMAAGYDLVLAGLDHADVRPGDDVLAGEPVGTMPKTGGGMRLYFELRQNGHGTNPAPWLAVELRKAQRS